MGRRSGLGLVLLSSLTWALGCSSPPPSPSPSPPPPSTPPGTTSEVAIVLWDGSRPVRGLVPFLIVPAGVGFESVPRLVTEALTIDGAPHPMPWREDQLAVLDTRTLSNGPHRLGGRVRLGDRTYAGEVTITVDNDPPDANGARFTDVTEEAGFPAPGAASRLMSGAVPRDLDGDGDEDLVVFRQGTAELRWNEGGWRFRVEPLAAGMEVVSVAAADLDRDGRDDLVLAGAGVQVWRGLEGGRFEDATEWAGVPGWARAGQLFKTVSLADLDEDGLLDVLVAQMACGQGGNLVLRNEGALRFASVERALGVSLEKGATFALVVDRPGEDGPDELWAYEEGCTPELTSVRKLSVGDAGPVADEPWLPFFPRLAPMGSAWIDIDRDGVLDKWVAGGLASFAWRGPRYDVDLATFAGISAWHDELRRITAAWSTVHFDADGDGLADLFVVHDPDGGPRDELRSPRHALYRQVRPGRFTDVTAEAGLDVAAACRAARGSDLDGDGDVDLVAGCRDGLRVYRNDRLQSARTRTLRLDGGLSNPDGLAAHVRTTRGEYRLVRGGGQLYASGVAYENVAVEPGETVSVRWPSGLSQAVTVPPDAGPVVTLREPVRVELGSRRVKPGGAAALAVDVGASAVTVTAKGGSVDAPVRGDDGVWRASVRAGATAGEVVLTVAVDGVPLRVRPRLFVRPD